MRICLVSSGYPPEDGGGIGTYTYNLARGLREQGHEVYVLTQSSREVIDCDENGVHVYRYKVRHLSFFERCLPGLAWSVFVSRKIEELDKEHHLDIVEFPNWEGVGFYYSSKRSRKSVVVRMHTPFFEICSIENNNHTLTMGDKFTCWLERKSCEIADVVTSSTQHHAQMMQNTYSLNRDNIRIIPLGLDIPCIPHKHFDYKSQRSDSKISILYVSRLEHRKGVFNLIEVMPNILYKYPCVEFVFIGRDRPHAPGGMLFKDYFFDKYPELSDRVHFLGFVDPDKLVENYKSADIFVVPSVYESFGLIYIEAMFYGIPIIAGNGGGIPEVVVDGEVGYLVGQNDLDNLNNKLSLLIEDRELRNIMGRRGQDLANNTFTCEKMAINTLKAYDLAMQVK